MKRSLPVPIAFETGVNYLRPLSTELHDGTYFREIANTADCGILLDLHNLWANEINGRATLDDVLTACPLDRVWEVHLAGGFRKDGYYLDAHSGPVSDGLLEILARWIGRMPNLRAVVYEILPEHIASAGIDRIANQLHAMREVLTRGNACEPSKPPVPSIETHRSPAAPRPASPSTTGARLQYLGRHEHRGRWAMTRRNVAQHHVARFGELAAPERSRFQRRRHLRSGGAEVLDGEAFQLSPDELSSTSSPTKRRD